MRSVLCSSALLLAAFTVIAPAPAEAQGVLVPLNTRDVLVRQRARVQQADAQVATAAAGQRQEAQTRADRERDRDYGWFTRLNDLEAAELWASPRGSLLPAARVSPGTDRTALYTELAQAVSGGWRFVLGTALAVETDADEEDETEGGDLTAQQAEEEDPSTGFRRFVSGGGNLSFAAMRPLSMMSSGGSDHVIVAIPRVWANIPTLSDTEGVEDFGGELAGEYSYLRYARKLVGDTLSTKPELPFMTLQVRAGWVMGSNAFYRTIGHTDQSMFLYTVPSLNLQFDNGVKVGVSYFWGLGDFTEHENLSFHVTLAPPQPRG